MLLDKTISLLDTVILQIQMNVSATPVEMEEHVKTRTTSTVVNVRPVSTVSTVKQVRIIHNIVLCMVLVFYHLFFFTLRKLG